jgi:hypothetical protein
VGVGWSPKPGGENDKKLRDLYWDYFLSSFGTTTATRLSKLLNGAISHNQVTRFLSVMVKRPMAGGEIIRTGNRIGRRGTYSLMIAPKRSHTPMRTTSFAGANNHTQDCNGKGINFLTALYHSHGVSLPVAF